MPFSPEVPVATETQVSAKFSEKVTPRNPDTTVQSLKQSRFTGISKAKSVPLFITQATTAVHGQFTSIFSFVTVS
jgi:hypothetical protein